MRSVFIIREKQTQSYCISSKHAEFGAFDSAAIFLSAENAAKARKDMLREWVQDWAVTEQDIRTVYYRNQENLDATLAYHGIAFCEGMKLLDMDLEIVEFVLSEVK